MRIFVDTEFTDFIDCDLISIALVADDGREFYAERTDFDRHACAAFVREAVLPQLGQYPERMFSRASLHAALHEWLAQFGGGTFCMDFHGDWDLLVDILDGAPDGWAASLVWDETQCSFDQRALAHLIVATTGNQQWLRSRLGPCESVGEFRKAWEAFGPHALFDGFKDLHDKDVSWRER